MDSFERQSEFIIIVQELNLRLLFRRIDLFSHPQLEWYNIYYRLKKIGIRDRYS